MKYILWMVLLLIAVPFMLIGVGSTEMTEGEVVREAFLGEQYGIEFDVDGELFFIQIM